MSVRVPDSSSRGPSPRSSSADRWLPAGVLALLSAACVTTSEKPPPAADPAREPQELESVAPPPPELPWPSTFLDESILMAEVVRIEGPPRLRDHLALMQDKDHHELEVTAIATGLLQRTSVREDIEYHAPIRCQLDRLTILAERELLVLERPGEVPVSITAEGDAFYKLTGAAEEQRGARLTIVGRP
jgi:hypothetical protein